MNLFWKCLVVVSASIVQSLGLTLQRLSYLDPPLPSSGVWPTPDQRKHSVQMWRAGSALFIGANIFGSAVQLALLPLVLVCALQAIGLVANAVFATLISKEPVTPFAALGTVSILAGAMIVAALSGTQDDPDVSLNESLKLFKSWRFSGWMFVTSVVAGSLILRQASSHPVEFRLKHYSTSSPSAATTAESTSNHQQDILNATDAENTYTKSARLSGFSWGIVGGIASAHSLLMAKSAIGLVVRDYRDLSPDLEQVQFWSIIVMFLIFAPGQMWCVNCGSRYVSTSVLYPLIFCVYNVVEILNSVMSYGTVVISWSQLVWVATGTTILFFGVMLLSTRFDGEQPVASTPPAEESSRVWLEWLRGFGRIPFNSVNLANDRCASPTSYPTLPTSRLASPRYDGSRPESPSSERTVSPLRGHTSPGSPRAQLASSPRVRSIQAPPLQRRTSSHKDPSTPKNTQNTSIRHFSQHHRSDSTSSENVPSLNNVTYTSFDSISPSITNPDKVRGRHSRVVLSKEQHRILRELGM